LIASASQVTLKQKVRNSGNCHLRSFNNTFTAETRARDAFNAAEEALSDAEANLHDTEEEISRMNNVEWFGAEGEWKKLDQTCLTTDAGE
jgi:protein kinase C substrate 80K-H